MATTAKALPPSAPTAWRMPIAAEGYDRDPALSPDERAALDVLVRRSHAALVTADACRARVALRRLDTPLGDVAGLRPASATRRVVLRRVLFREMARRGTAYWGWSAEDWREVLCPSGVAFARRHGCKSNRVSLMDAAYLLGSVTDLTAVGQTRYAAYLAAGIFGAERIEAAYARVAAVLVGPQGWGYSDGTVVLDTLRHVLSLLFLLNRSPYLEDLSSDLLRYAAGRVNLATRQRLPKVGRVLQYLGIIDIDQPAGTPIRPPGHIDGDGIAPEWVAWCEAWRARDTRLSPRRRQTVFGQMLCVGRWLAAAHPDIVSPEQWDEDLALEYVSYICTARIGDHLTAAASAHLRRRGLAGRQLSPRSIDAKIGYVRRFFADLQDRPHRTGDQPARTIAIRFRPERALETPAHIQRLFQPDPRDIDPQIWYKLTYAAATLTDEDLKETIVHYPLSFHRAVALLWVTAARRLNELRRLRVGCVRRTWEPGMVAEDGRAIAEEERLSYLHIPANKTRGPFWVWIPEYTADAIEAWERERPVGQPKRVDPKDGSVVDFLFCSRNMIMSDRFLNGSLIPLLCAKGGVPERDARGAITSHRGRSTIATMLRRRGVSLDDIADYLGHANSNTVRSYARTDPAQFARAIKRANELDRLVDVLVDPRAAAAGKPHVFYFLGRGADGRPRYCGNPAWVACPHRLACLKCSMYVGASQAEVLEARLGGALPGDRTDDARGEGGHGRRPRAPARDRGRERGRPRAGSAQPRLHLQPGWPNGGGSNKSARRGIGQTDGIGPQASRPDP